MWRTFELTQKEAERFPSVTCPIKTVGIGVILVILQMLQYAS